MKKTWLWVLCLALATSTWAQQTPKSYTSNTESDQEAERILQQLRKTYDSYTSMEADFTLEIKLPDQTEVQKGKIIQKGDKYRLTLKDQLIISNGSTLWFYLKDNNEVQVNDVDEEEDEILSPAGLLRVYDRKDFVSRLANEGIEDGETVRQIEFKPLDRDSEYSKMRITVSRNSDAIKRIMVFSKDGSRYTLTIDNLTPNKTYSDDTFSFDEADYPKVRVEDLRID